MAAKTLPDQAYLRECFEYDPFTGVLTWRERPLEHFFDKRSGRIWNTKHGGNAAGNLRDGYLYVGLGKRRLAHRVIFKMMTGEEPSEIDHRNCIRDDNRWDNLRAATRLTNSWNHPGQDNRTTPRKGIRFQKGAWTARIAVKGKAYHLGSFSTEEDAHRAYCDAAVRLHGEFANFGMK